MLLMLRASPANYHVFRLRISQLLLASGSVYRSVTSSGVHPPDIWVGVKFSARGQNFQTTTTTITTASAAVTIIPFGFV